jgi:hypothetical protein
MDLEHGALSHYVSDIAKGVRSITELWSAGAPACGLPLFRSAILT